MKKSIVFLVLLGLCIVIIVSGCALPNTNQGEFIAGKDNQNAEETIVHFKNKRVQYFVCFQVNGWMDGNLESVFELTQAQCETVEFINLHCATDCETLEDLKYLKNLKRLWMNPIPEPEDIRERRVKMEEHSAELVAELGEILPQLPKLEELYIGADMTVRDLSFLQQVNGLKILTITCGMEDISGIGRMPDLEEVRFGTGNIVNISPLQDLKNLRVLTIANNKVEDLSPLESMINLERINLANNNISDISPLLGLKHLNVIDIFENPVCEDEEQMQLLRDTFPGARINVTNPYIKEDD